MLDTQIRAQRIELVLAGGSASAQAEQTVGELFLVIGKNGADADRTGPLQIAQEPAGIGGRFGLVDADEDPTGGAVDGYEQLAPRGFVSHLREILDVHVQITRLVGFEGRMFWSWLPCGQSPQIAHPMPAQAAVQPRA